MNAVPGISSVGIDSLVDERLVEVDRLPCGIVEGRVGPSGIVTDLKAPGPLRLRTALMAGPGAKAGAFAAGPEGPCAASDNAHTRIASQLSIRRDAGYRSACSMIFISIQV